MKDVIIRSDRLTVHANALGAELKGVEMDGLEYLWQGDVDSYTRTSPTLFPIVGRFLSDTYYVGDRPYGMQLNGIVMDRNFRCASCASDRVVFQLEADERTRQSYPFDFALTVGYAVQGDTLAVSYKVENRGSIPMPFCLGCHTAYNWPLLPGDDPQDYSLRFEKEEALESFNPFGWRQPFVQGRERPLSHALFTNYTRSVTGLRSTWLEFGSRKHGRRVRIRRGSFSYLAMWTPHDHEAPLLCLEPCTGLQPGNHGCLRLEDRDGCITLSPGEAWEGGFWLSFS